MELLAQHPLLLVVASIIGGFITSKVFDSLVNRWFKTKDEAKTLHDTNQAKMIDADQVAMTHYVEEVKGFKAEVKELREKLDIVNEQRAELNADNKILRSNEEHLKERVDRQGKRIEQLESDLSTTKNLLDEAKAALQRRDGEILTLRSELQETRLEVHALALQMKGTELSITNNA